MAHVFSTDVSEVTWFFRDMVGASASSKPRPHAPDAGRCSPCFMLIAQKGNRRSCTFQGLLYE